MSKRPNLCRPFTRRQASPGSTGKTILIVTEGEKTEPDYLKGLRNNLRLHAADIYVTSSQGTDPLSVVKYAISLRNERRREVRRGSGVAYDSVWAVFDTERADTNPRLNDALQKAKANRIQVGVSNPCFEFWLLLHDEHTTAPFDTCTDVITRIKERFFANYQKGAVCISPYIQKIPDAVQRAELCRRHKINAGTDGNPSTEMDLLVREMNEATRGYYRLNLRD